MLPRLDLVMLCADNSRSLLGKAIGSFHIHVSTSNLAPLSFIAPIRKKVIILKTPTKKLKKKKNLVLGRRNKKTDYMINTFFSCAKSLKRNLQV